MADRPFAEYAIVRIVQLHQSHRHWLSSEGVGRPPAVGDTGTIVHVYALNDPATPYIIECVDDSGLTLWLADFDWDELASVQTPAT